MENILDRITKLGKQLLPTGRAFRPSKDSNMEKLILGLAKSKYRADNDATSILYSMIPDNDYFTEDDATDWERRLGLITNSLTPLADRKLAILRKMAAPGLNPAKAHFLWLQKQLQDAGFNVYVHENIFPAYPSGYERVNPGSLNPSILSEVEQGIFEQGGAEQGDFINSIVANSIYNDADLSFNFGQDYGGVFFIGGNPVGSYANVLASREHEFRQLILGLKQAPLSAVLFINYI